MIGSRWRRPPAVHAASTEIFAPLGEADRERLIGMLTTVRVQLAAVEGRDLVPPAPRRKRSA